MCVLFFSSSAIMQCSLFLFIFSSCSSFHFIPTVALFFLFIFPLTDLNNKLESDRTTHIGCAVFFVSVHSRRSCCCFIVCFFFICILFLFIDSLVMRFVIYAYILCVNAYMLTSHR